MAATRPGIKALQPGFNRKILTKDRHFTEQQPGWNKNSEVNPARRKLNTLGPETDP